MKDVTSLFETYRECVRHLWNAYYRAAAESESKQDWDLRDEFSVVAQGIFASLVLRPLEAMDRELAPDWAPNPSILEGFTIAPISECPIHINRDLSRCGYWDYPLERVRPEEVELAFLRFFDFDQLDFRDFRYYEVLIQASEPYPDTGQSH